MDFDYFRSDNLRRETKAELLSWKAQWKPSSPQHIAANVELVRRDDMMKSRLWTALTIVVVSLIVAAVVWFRSYLIVVVS